MFQIGKLVNKCQENTLIFIFEIFRLLLSAPFQFLRLPSAVNGCCRSRMPISGSPLDSYFRHFCSVSLTNLFFYQGKIEAEIHLYQERLEKNQIQWKEHCESRVQETMRNAENLAEQKLEVWRNDVETKLQSMVSSLNYQLGILKSK